MNDDFEYALADLMSEVYTSIAEIADSSYRCGYVDGFRESISPRKCKDVGNERHLTFKCSACKESWLTPQSRFFKFCPSCGAEIDRGTE